jgi:hypothetical protein
MEGDSNNDIVINWNNVVGQEARNMLMNYVCMWNCYPTLDNELF